MRLGGTYSDNITLANRGQEESDFVLEAGPGISVRGEGGRVRGTLDYQLQALYYTGGKGSNRLQHYLTHTGNLEAVDDFFFVDTRASVAQQNRSAFGPQGTGVNATSNRTETRAFGVSPYIRSTLGSVASYELRYNSEVSDADTSDFARSRINEWMGTLRSLSTQALFGWGFDYHKRNIDYSDNRDNETELYRALLIYNFDPQLKFSANVGKEENNFNLIDNSGTIYGAGVDWTPSPRTTVTANWNHRVFGNGFGYSFNHRTPLSGWKLSYVKDIQTTTGQLLNLEPSFDYAIRDAFIRANPDLFPQFQDPVARDAAIRRDLAQQGLPVFANTNPALANRPFLDKRLEAAMSLFGARNTVTVSIYRSRRQALQTNALADDFALSQDIEQRGGSIHWRHAISGFTDLNASVSRTRSKALNGGNLTTEYTFINVGLLRRLGPQTTAALTYRNSRGDSSGAGRTDYRENAVFGTLTILF